MVMLVGVELGAVQIDSNGGNVIGDKIQIESIGITQAAVRAGGFSSI